VDVTVVYYLVLHLHFFSCCMIDHQVAWTQMVMVLIAQVELVRVSDAITEEHAHIYCMND